MADAPADVAKVILFGLNSIILARCVRTILSMPESGDESQDFSSTEYGPAINVVLGSLGTLPACTKPGTPHDRLLGCEV